MSILLNSSAGVRNPACLKRKGSDEEDDQHGASKKTRYSYYVTLESESPLPTSEDDESIYTVQGNETEYVQDTSDTSSSEDDDDIAVRLEFEVASHSEEENPMLYGTSSSDPEDFVTMGVLAAICNETDMGLADDSDDSRSTVDSEIGKADYWTCIQCNNRNNNPLFRYCEKCYQIRKNFFPPRPQRKRRRKKAEIKETTAVPKSLNSQDELSSQDSGLGSLGIKSSQETVNSQKPESPERKESMDTVDFSKEVLNEQGAIDRIEDNGIINVDCRTEIKNSLDSENTQSKKIDSDSDNKMCLTCTVNPKNGAFAHGSILHVCCCYKCAVRVWRTSKHCPICNRKITNVLKVFYN